jgi:aryl-alcohol dehydrogenase-like predicted oxidoreductase
MTLASAPRRSLGPFDVSPLGFGCMCLSHAYGTPPAPDEAAKVLHRAIDTGYTMLDSAALYGFGNNETLLGNALKDRPRDYILTSKCGMFKNDKGVREIDGRPETLRRTCEDSLRRLQTDVIDLYYLHRWDKRLPLEDQIGTLGEFVREGKVRTIGLSEVSAATIRRAHAVHPITAVQTEYSLWTRNAEVASLDACRDLGIAFVAFSPIARGFLSDAPPDPATLPPKDIRLGMPRFQAAHWPHNVSLLPAVREIARGQGCTVAQLALAWVLAQGDHIIPIPGTTRIDHLEENAAAVDVRLATDTLARLDALINAKTVSGARYNDATLPEIDTEEIPAQF